MTDCSFTFQRARRPEQREARRRAILDAAAAMLAESSVTEISLRSLSSRVGLAKSNVLRYFESREAVFLELLDLHLRDWLAALAEDLPAEPAGAERLADSMAASLSARPLLCELVSVTAGVLERNISVEVARRFKVAAMARGAELAALTVAQVPELDEGSAQHFASTAFALVAGMWPLANPTEQVATAVRELGLRADHLVFDQQLRETLAVHLTGLLARVGSRN